MIEMSVRQYDGTWPASPAKSCLRGGSEVGGRPRHPRIDECPVPVACPGPAKEYYVDDRNLTVSDVRSDLARFVIAQLVVVRTVCAGSMRQGDLCHGTLTLWDSGLGLPDDAGRPMLISGRCSLFLVEVS
jgi:hypothetical protein